MLASQVDASARPNDHPAEPTADEIAAMLATLRMRFVDEEPEVAPNPVFTQEEIGVLGDALATGLGRAASTEDVLFHVIGSRRVTPGAFTKRNRVTAGRVFYRDGSINIIFGQIQTPYRKRNVYGQTDEDFYPRNYGSRAAATEHQIVLLTTDAIRLYQSGDVQRNDWIVIDVDAAIAAASEDNDAVEAVPADAAVAATVGLAAASTVSQDPVVEANPAASVEERLTELKRLLELELISEEAYQARMQDILKDL